jgi:hypothetical protein
MRRSHVCFLIWAGLLWGISVKAENTLTCPDSFQDLATSLSQDLPNYLNRTYTRLGIQEKATFANFPEINPLPLAASNGDKTLPVPHQLFISILTGRIGQPKTQTQPYWLLISKTNKGWRLAMAFTKIGTSPPTDISDGAIADATRTWLRDRCN